MDSPSLRIDRRLTLGAVICVALSLLALGPASTHLGWLELLIVVGMLVVAPLGWCLLFRERGPGRFGMFVWKAQAIAAAAGIGSVFIARGTTSAVLAIPWAIVSLMGMAVAFGRPASEGRDRTERLIAAEAATFQVLAAFMLLAWRGRSNPFGLDDMTVGSSVAYLQFVGFGSSVIASRVLATSSAPERTSVVRSATGIAIATGLIAVGLMAWVPVAVVGAVMLGVACARVALGGFRRARAGARSRTRALSAISFVGVGTEALIGVTYAVGRLSGHAWLTAPETARLIAASAGLVFVIPGLLAWLLRPVERGAGEPSEERAERPSTFRLPL